MDNMIVLSDNIKFLNKLSDECIDLAYGDIIFNSDQEWLDTDETDFEIRYFSDMWDGGIETYLSILEPTFLHLHRILKKNGSIVIHCDPFASHYIKSRLLDKIFGENNFRSEIIWPRALNEGSWKSISKSFSKNHDTLFWYTKSNKYTFNIPRRDRTLLEIERDFKHNDHDGKGPYQTCALTHENEREKYKARGELILRPKAKFDRYKFYLKDHQTVVDKSDIWNDIDNMSSTDKERVNHPTQKPIQLLEKIIKCLTNPGDCVIDVWVVS